jgi:acetyltransferase
MKSDMPVESVAGEKESASCGSGLPTVPSGHFYPDQYTLRIDLPEVGPIKVRPIQRDDAPMLEEMFRSLTPRSVYLRFFSFLRQLPPGMLERFTCIDYRNEVALIALRKEKGEEKMVGDARVVETSEPGNAEFSVMVSDPLQGKGIGACLLKNCLAIAGERGFRRIYGIVLPENKQMLALGRKLGFEIKHMPGSIEYELSKDMVRDER